MKKLFLSLGVVLYAALALAQTPRVQLTYKEDKNGNPRYELRGENLYEADFFRIRVTDEYWGDSDWYESGSGATRWDINVDNGTFYMQISPSILEPGYTFEVRTYAEYVDDSTEEIHRFRFFVPCDRNSYYDSFTDTLWVYENPSYAPPSCRPGYPVPPSYPPSYPPAPPAPAPLSCDASARISAGNPARANISVSCTRETGADIRVYDKGSGNLLCSADSRYIGSGSLVVCEVPRRTDARSVYTIEVRTAKGELFTKSATINKDPTYNYSPEGTYQHGLSVVPQKEEKFGWRGYYWEAVISATVADRDLDPADNNSLKADLILVKNGGERKLQTGAAYNNGVVTFHAYHEFVDPWFGEPKHEGDLDMGANTLKIRVWDAYEGKTFVDLPAVTVDVRE